jgi:hypothetical protein
MQAGFANTVGHAGSTGMVGNGAGSSMWVLGRFGLPAPAASEII